MKHGTTTNTLSWIYPAPRISIILYSTHHIQSISELYQICNTKLDIRYSSKLDAAFNDETNDKLDNYKLLNVFNH